MKKWGKRKRKREKKTRNPPFFFFHFLYVGLGYIYIYYPPGITPKKQKRSNQPHNISKLRKGEGRDRKGNYIEKERKRRGKKATPIIFNFYFVTSPLFRYI